MVSFQKTLYSIIQCIFNEQWCSLKVEGRYSSAAQVVRSSHVPILFKGKLALAITCLGPREAWHVSQKDEEELSLRTEGLILGGMMPYSSQNCISCYSSQVFSLRNQILHMFYDKIILPLLRWWHKYLSSFDTRVNRSRENCMCFPKAKKPAAEIQIHTV